MIAVPVAAPTVPRLTVGGLQDDGWCEGAAREEAGAQRAEHDGVEKTARELDIAGRATMKRADLEKAISEAGKEKAAS